MPVQFKGIAHPAPPRNGKRNNVADLSRAEIATTNLGRRGGTEVRVEHEPGGVGRVHSSWEGRDGSLRVSGVISNAKAEQLVKSGSMRGLSLGSSVIQSASGERIVVAQDELSICEAPRRPGCFIDELDGRSVLRNVRASAKGEPLPPPRLTPQDR